MTLSTWIRFLPTLITATVLLFLDQSTKNIVFEGGTFYVTSFLNITNCFNYGISFGLFAFAGMSQVFFIFIAFIIALFALYYIYTAPSINNVELCSIGLVLGGAAGNVMDRIYHGAVRDFLDLHIMHYHWPAFNVADAGIVLGSLILLLFYTKYDIISLAKGRNK